MTKIETPSTFRAPNLQLPRKNKAINAEFRHTYINNRKTQKASNFASFASIGREKNIMETRVEASNQKKIAILYQF